MMSRVTQEGVKFIKQEEGLRNKMYHDQAGLPTIGVGHLLTKDELSSGKILCLAVNWQFGLSDDQCEELLRRDLFDAEETVEKCVTVPLTPQQFDALVSFVFNVGVGAFKNSTLLKQLNNKQYASVPTQLRRWVYGGGRRLAVLAARREREIALWKKGSQ